MTEASPWIERFPDLAALPAEDRRRLSERAAEVLAAGPAPPSSHPARRPRTFFWCWTAWSGCSRSPASGREIVLYRVSAGEACIMTTACLLSSEPYNAEGITETEVKAIAIPRAPSTRPWPPPPGSAASSSPATRTASPTSCRWSRRSAFQRLDKRLAQRLLSLAGSDRVIQATHQELAAELGTAREVVTRQLKELERRGWVTLSRGEVRLTQLDQLQALAEAE